MIHALENRLFEKKVGSNSAKHILTEKIVAKILKEKGISKEVGKKYGVSEGCIADIRTGRTWNHVTGLPQQRTLKANIQ